MRSTLLKGIVGGFAIKICGTVLTLFMGIVLARVLGARGLGEYSFFLAITTFLVMLSQIGFPVLLVRMVATYHIEKKWGLLRGLLIKSIEIVLAISMVLLIIVLAIGLEFTPESFSGTSTLIWALMLVPLLSLINLQAAALRGLHHVLWAQILEPTLRYAVLTILLLGFSYGMGVEMLPPQQAMSFAVYSAVLTLILSAVLLRRKAPGHVFVRASQYETKSWIKSALPLMLAGGAQLINAQTDLLMLGVFSVPEDVGVYRVAVAVAGLTVFLLSVANSVTSPYFAKLYVQGDRAQLQKLVSVSSLFVFATSLPLVIFIITYNRSILELAFGGEYIRAGMALSVLCVGQIASVAMGPAGVVLNMTGHEKQVAVGISVGAFLNVVLNTILIPVYGIEGAALATAISTFSWHALLALFAYNSVGIQGPVFYSRMGRLTN